MTVWTKVDCISVTHLLLPTVFLGATSVCGITHHDTTRCSVVSYKMKDIQNDILKVWCFTTVRTRLGGNSCISVTHLLLPTVFYVLR